MPRIYTGDHRVVPWLLILLGMALPSWAQWVPPVEMEVMDPSGTPLAGWTVSLCPDGVTCREFRVDQQGLALVDRDLLLDSATLTIILTDPVGESRRVLSNWKMSQTDRWLARNRPGLLRGQLRATGDMDLALTFSRLDLPPVKQVETPPSWYLAGGVLILGGDSFGSDDQALGSGVEVSPGLGIALGKRFGLPDQHNSTLSSFTFLDVTARYGLNRFEVADFGGEGPGDVSFHGLSLAVGPGKAWRKTRISLQGVLAYGGVFDGDELLEREGRDYGMVGFGVTAKISRRVLELAGLPLGIFVEGSALTYQADALEDDHWHGFAPSVLMGLTLD